ncbi:MAG: ABC transporter permease, partial [Bacilli bacterium]|nr:ABC transporter permease [Bacilli bacterium]
NWVGSILTEGNWGTSVSVMQNVDAMVIIMERLPTTIKVNIWPTIISVPAGIALGVWAALKKNKLTDHIISTLVMIFISVPSFIVITFLMLLLCFNFKVFPTQWPKADDPIDVKILGYFIPTMALSFGSICGYCRSVRAELTEVMSSDFLLLARTKGLTRSQAIVRHAMKNAMVPILPSILAEVIGLLFGAMILEQIYGIPGVGQLYIKSINAKDYNVLMADMALYTLIGLVSGVFLDLSYSLIDPRIRMGARK